MPEHQTPIREVQGSIFTGGTMLCPSARHINSPKYWLKPRKWWLHRDMTEKLLTGMLNLNTKLMETIKSGKV